MPATLPDFGAAEQNLPDFGGQSLPEFDSAPAIKVSQVNLNLVSTTAGGTKGGGLNLEPFTKNDLPDLVDAQEEVANLSRPAIALPKFTVKPDDSKTAAVAKSAANLLISLPEFAESPWGIASIATGSVAPKLVAGAFLGDTAKNVVQQSKEAGKNWDAMTPAEKAATLTDLGGQTVLAAALAHGAGGAVADAIDLKVNQAGMLARELNRTKPKLPDFTGTKPVPIVQTSEPAADNQFPLGKGFQTPAGEPVESTAAIAAERTPTENVPAAAASPAAPPEQSNANVTLDPHVKAETPLVPVDVTDKDIKAFQTSVGMERAPDVLDDIESVTSKPVKFTEPDYAQTIDNARQATFTKAGRPSAETGRLDNRISANEGEPADKVLQQLAKQNPKYADWTRDDLAAAIIDAHSGREQGEVASDLPRQLAEQQARAQLFQSAGGTDRPGQTEPLPVEQTMIGDTFKVNGQPMRVIDQPVDPETGKPHGVLLEGAYGRQMVPAGTVLHIDQKSLLPDLVQPGRVAASGTSAPRAAKAGGTPTQGKGNGGGTAQPGRGQPLQRPLQVPPVVAKLPAPPAGPVKSWLGNYTSGFKRVFAPHTIDSGAETVANILRDVNGEKANNLSRADEAMHNFRREFDTTPVPGGYKYDPSQPLPHNYAVINALETDRANLPDRYKPLAQYFDQAFQDRIKVIQQFAPNALQHLIENYFPHIWEDPKRAAGVMQQVANKLFSGRKEFLKQRSLPMFTDGLERGLKPISDNPVDLLLAKMHSMDKFIAALKAQAEFKSIGKMKFKYALEGMPDGWEKVDDPAFVVNAPPTVTIKEAYDATLRTRTLELLQKLGVKNSRLATLGGKRWGMAYESPEQIKTRFAGPMSVYFHELGHILDYRYDLQKDFLKQGKQFDSELRSLAEKRLPVGYAKTKAVFSKSQGKTVNRPTSMTSYVRSGPEKMAVMSEAYVHAPEEFKRSAPMVYAKFDRFIKDHPELHDIRALKPSLRLEAGEMEQKLPGLLKLGDWIMPEGPAQVMKNYLSPGLSQSGIYRSVRAASNLLNAAQLGLSGFHVGFTSLDAVVNAVEVGMFRGLHGDFAGAGRTLAKAPIAPVHNYFVGKAVQRAMLDPKATHIKAFGVNVAISKAAHDYAALAVKGGLRATVDPFWQTHMTRNLVRAVHEGGLAWAKTPLYAPLALVEQAMRPIAEYLVPRQKLGVFALLAKSEMERLSPGANVHEVRAAMARAANSTEDRMGQMTYDNLFYNRVAKDLSLLAFRAYGWQLGKYRHLIGAASDTVGNVKQLAAGRLPHLTHRQLYFPALVGVVGGIGGLMHYMMTGKPPQSERDYLHPSTGQKDSYGNDKRLSLPSYLKDLESDAFAIGSGWSSGGPLGVGKGLWTATYHRANPWVGQAVDILNNRDFYGTQIWNPDDPLSQKMLDQAQFIAKEGIPFSIAGAMKLSEGDASLRDKVMPFIGIVPAKQAISMTPAQLKAAEIAQAQSSVGGRTQAQAQHSKALRDAVADLKSNKPLTFQPDKSELATIKQRMAMTPMQLQVHNMPMELAMRVYDLANPQEKAQLQPILLKRLQDQNKAKERINPDYVRILTQTIK